MFWRSIITSLMYRGYLHQTDGLSACIYIGKVKQFHGSRFLS